MAKKHFMPRTDLEKQLWLQNFAAKLPGYASKYNISTADLTDTQSGSDKFTYWLNYRNQYNEFLKKLTRFKNELSDGVDAGATPSVEPQPPSLPASPAVAAPGVFVRAAAIANIIKKNSLYTEADGNDLGIEGADSAVDPNSLKPVLNVRLIEGGKPEVQWQKNDTDGIEIWVDRGDSRWVFLAVDTYPHYTDTAPLPEGVTSAIWKYKAIYRWGDTVAGQWSDVVSITVSVS